MPPTAPIIRIHNVNLVIKIPMNRKRPNRLHFNRPVPNHRWGHNPTSSPASLQNSAPPPTPPAPYNNPPPCDSQTSPPAQWYPLHQRRHQRQTPVIPAPVVSTTLIFAAGTPDPALCPSSRKHPSSSSLIPDDAPSYAAEKPPPSAGSVSPVDAAASVRDWRKQRQMRQNRPKHRRLPGGFTVSTHPFRGATFFSSANTSGKSFVNPGNNPNISTCTNEHH